MLLSIGLGRAGHTLPTPVLLESFESTTGFAFGSAVTNQVINTAREVQGAGALHFEGHGVAATTPIITKSALATQFDPSLLDVIVYSLDLESERGQNQISLQFGRSAVYVGETSLFGWSGFPTGRRFYACLASDYATMPTGVATTEMRIRFNSQNAPYNTRVNIDCAMGNAKGRPTVVIGFDDVFRSQYDIALPYLASKGMKGTLYVPIDRVGDVRISNYLTTAEVVALGAAGWAVCLDGTTDDSSMTGLADPAADVAEIELGRVWLAAHSFPAEGGNHICYPNGDYQVVATAVQVAAATGNGTTTVTFGAGANVLDGMTMRGVNVPDNTTVVSGGGVGTTSVVVSNTIPAQTKAADFIDKTGAFYYPALQTALGNAGVLTARTTNQDHFYSRFGFGDQALAMPARSTSAATLATLQPYIDRAIALGATFEMYIHDINGVGGSINMLDTDFYALIDYIATKKAAGILDVLTKPQWYARDVSGLATLPF